MIKPDTIETHDVKAVNAATERALYKKRDPIYPKSVSGRWRTIKWVAMLALLGIYYGVPWLRWDRGEGFPDQAVLVDFAGRRFYFFWIELWPQEVFYITGLLILAGLGLFLATSLFGRIWCGYACPQTVWTDLFIAVEHWIEGDRNARIRLDKAPWTLDKLRKKVAKHIIWLSIAFVTGGAWILYFHDAPTIARDFFTGYAPVTAYVFAFLLTFTTYTLAGAMREQVCTYMCPWPRIQGAMTDNESLSVTYRADRGEPRGTHKKTETWDGRGDCVDCKACVAACPMGIDIRDGLQFECINCALCIDACDDIMDKVGRPRGLIAYDTDANVIRRAEGRPPRIRFIRTRTIFYAVVFSLVGLLMLYVLMQRSTLDLNVIRDRSPNFVQLSDGRIRNSYTIKAINKDRHPHELVLNIEGMAGLKVSGLGIMAPHDHPHFHVPGDRVRAVRIFITAPATTGTHNLTFTLRDPTTGLEKVSEATFAGPAS
jgi:cytochrome c oxidase accessory protein FixG